MNAMPSRTLEERHQALSNANAIRYQRRDMKHLIRAGGDPIPFVTDPPSWLRTMKVRRFLIEIPKVGPRKAANIMLACGVSESRTMGGLGTTQRKRLTGVLRDIRDAKETEA